MSITRLTGQKLGPYVLQEPLGHGAHSVTYAANSPFMEGIFVLKILHPEVLAQIVILPDYEGSDALSRCRRDSDLAAALRHPAIVRIIEWSRDDVLPLVYLVSEFAAGEDVHARIHRRGRLSPGVVRELGLRISTALSPVHKLGVVHRGLTPRNLIFTPGRNGDEVLKIRDFGLAHLPILPGAIHDLAPYLAPELSAATSAGMVGEVASEDARADQFSLGAILYEALTGSAPPAHDEVGLVNAPPPVPLRMLCPDAPPFLLQAIERALSPIPNERFANLDDFTRALDNRAPGLRLSGTPLPPAFARSAMSTSQGGGALPAPLSRSLPPLYSSRDTLLAGSSAASPSFPLSLSGVSLRGDLSEASVLVPSGRSATVELETVDILEGAESLELVSSPRRMPSSARSPVGAYPPGSSLSVSGSAAAALAEPPGAAPAPLSASTASLSLAAGQRARSAQSLRRGQRSSGVGMVIATACVLMVIGSAALLVHSARLHTHSEPDEGTAVASAPGAAARAPGTLPAARALTQPPPAPPPVAVSADATVLLEQAEQALSQGELRRAMDLSRQALPALRAWRVLAVAACRSNDARLTSEAVGHLSELERRDVENSCRQR